MGPVYDVPRDQLSREQVRQIADLMLSELKERLKEEHAISLVLEESAIALLIEKGYDPEYGARPLRRTIERLIENPISELILEGTFANGSSVVARSGGEEIAFTQAG